MGITPVPKADVAVRWVGRLSVARAARFTAAIWRSTCTASSAAAKRFLMSAHFGQPDAEVV